MSEPVLRVLIFAGVFAVLVGAELAAPFRRLPGRRKQHWPGNLALFALGVLASRLVLPLGAVGFAIWIEGRGWGLLNAAGVPMLIAVPAAMILLDLAIYSQHVLFHRVPWLWSLHRVHHADTHMDVTTGVRFHPLEILLSIAIKLAVIAAVGAPPLAVFLFEVLLNAGAMFTHANIRLPARAETLIRAIFVTPGMHRVHHSAERTDTDSNYGFNLSIWDRLFATYRPEPAPGEAGMTFGLESHRAAGEQRLDRLLTQPFREELSEQERHEKA